MAIRSPGHRSTARGPVKETHLQQKRFIDIFDRFRFFTDCGRNRIYPDWTSVEFFNDRSQNPPIGPVQAASIDFQQTQRPVCYFAGNDCLVIDQGKITHPFKQSIGDTRRSAGPAGDFFGAAFFHSDIQDLRRTGDNLQ